MLCIGIPFGVFCGAIAGLCSSDVSLPARTWQMIGRIAAIAFVALCVALIAHVVRPSPGYWWAVAVAGGLALVSGNVAEYRNNGRSASEPPDVMDSR